MPHTAAIARLVTVALTFAAVAEAQEKPPLLETITISSSDCHFPTAQTVDEEIRRLREADAIAVISVDKIEIGLSDDGRTARTLVSGKLVEAVKGAASRDLPKPDGVVDFEFAGGPGRLGHQGKYPIINAGERYLVFFQYHLRWYPYLPFQIDDAGRLQQASRGGRNCGFTWTSPINGMPLADVVTSLRQK